MSILIYAEATDGKLKKTAFELASYAKATGEKVVALTINANNTGELGKYGVDKVLQVTNEALKNFNPKAISEVLTQATQQENIKTIVLSTTTDAKYLTPLLAVKLNAGFASNVVALPESLSPLKVKQAVFTNKAFAITELHAEINIIALSKNAFGLKESTGAAETVSFTPNLSESALQNHVTDVSKATNKVTIADAEIVVSGGRGLKGPENWGMIEELASVLGAATACSKPVSDIGWRPHSEHVGQTGKPVASNLYIAVGISGAIQHLAGVNASKVKVVINNDPEAPFFKAADYGVVGDAFEVVPKLIEKLKAFKAANN
ncbi:MAG: electron transfer flavoprotein subunit alpha/FixB family protein [Flavobacteriaceae bacterium]|nr:electron transfer flavoprotein subunit alpha/FixB family protein [Flavobacteriaceae bacterium]